MANCENMGCILLDRNILDWEWYTDPNTTRLFIHLLLTTSQSYCKWRGIDLDPGQIVSSYEKISRETGMTIKQIRTALNNLEKTGYVIHEVVSGCGLFTVVNYSEYQKPPYSGDRKDEV